MGSGTVEVDGGEDGGGPTGCEDKKGHFSCLGRRLYNVPPVGGARYFWSGLKCEPTTLSVCCHFQDLIFDVSLYSSPREEMVIKNGRGEIEHFIVPLNPSCACSVKGHPVLEVEETCRNKLPYWGA